MRLGEIGYATANYEVSISVYTDAIKLDKYNPELFVRRGEANRKLGNIVQAKADFQEALRLDEEFIKAIDGYAFSILDQLGLDKNISTNSRNLLLQDALNVFTKGVKLLELQNDATTTTHLVELLYGRALTLIKLQMFPDATSDLNRVIGLNLKYAPAYQALGECYHALGEYKNAIAKYGLFMAHSREYYYGNRVQSESENEKHIAVILMADTILKICICQIELHEYGNAKTALDELIKSKCGTKLGHAYHWRGKIWHTEKNWWKVIECNTEAVKIDKNLTGAFNDRAFAYEMVGLITEAEEDKRMVEILQRERYWKGQRFEKK